MLAPTAYLPIGTRRLLLVLMFVMQLGAFCSASVAFKLSNVTPTLAQLASQRKIVTSYGA